MTQHEAEQIKRVIAARQLYEERLAQQAKDSRPLIFNVPSTASTASGTSNNYSIYYLRSSIGEPWEYVEHTNVNELDSLFTRWSLQLFETASVTNIFRSETTYIFMDGSDSNANALATFLEENRSVIEDWVYNGGKLFLNAAPNVGGNIDFGFGDTTLLFAEPEEFEEDGLYTEVTIAEGSESHSIFVGPGNPGTDWTGTYFAHGSLSGTGLTELIVSTSTSQELICASKYWGSGEVIFGSMTLTTFHEPESQAVYLRKNIHSYLSGVEYTPNLGLLLSFNPNKPNSANK